MGYWLIMGFGGPRNSQSWPLVNPIIQWHSVNRATQFLASTV